MLDKFFQMSQTLNYILVTVLIVLLLLDVSPWDLSPCSDHDTSTVMIALGMLCRALCFSLIYCFHILPSLGTNGDAQDTLPDQFSASFGELVARLSKHFDSLPCVIFVVISSCQECWY